MASPVPTTNPVTQDVLPASDDKIDFTSKSINVTSAATNAPSPTPTPHTTTSKRKHAPFHRFRESKRAPKFLDFILQATAAVAAITFGIWAPLSYKATLDGNGGNDAATSSLMSAQSAAASAQSSMASVQGDKMNAIESRQVAMGQLWLVIFCAAQTVSMHTSFFEFVKFLLLLLL
jgi:hypothetical protein